MDVIAAIFAIGDKKDKVLVCNPEVEFKVNGANLAKGDWMIGMLELKIGNVVFKDVCVDVEVILIVVDGMLVDEINSLIGLIWKSLSHKAGIPGSTVVEGVGVDVVLLLRLHLNLFPALFVGHLPRKRL